MPCLHHCHSISVTSLPAPPLTISTLKSQTVCLEERAESGGAERGWWEKGRSRGGGEKKGRGERYRRGSGVK